MILFRDLPLRRKVTALILGASGLALVFAAVGVIIYDLLTLRPRVENDLASQAELLAANTAAALRFGDAVAARENLATLEARPEIPAAAVLTPDGNTFATYTRTGRRLPSRLPVTGAGTTEQNGLLVHASPVTSDGQTIGWLVLWFEFPPFWTRLPQYGLLAMVVIFSLLTVSLLLFRFLRRNITSPLHDLAGAARAVSERGDYDIRVTRPARDEIGELATSFNDMLATIQARDRALQESASRLREVMLAARMVSWEWERDSGRLEWGETRLDLPQGFRLPRTLDEFLGIVHEDDLETFRDALDRTAAGQALDLDIRLVIPDAIRWLALRGQANPPGLPTGAYGLAVDVTERRLLEEQLNQSQRLEAIGRLAGGIAHDFNNLLTVILGYARFAAKALPHDSMVRADMLQIERAGQRAAGLTSQLLSYARRQMIAPRPTSLNRLVEGLRDLLRRLIGEHIDLRVESDPELWPARMDPGQFEQVIVNLAVNARDAMPDGGQLVISTRNLSVTAAAPPPQPEVQPGEYVLLRVSDNGAGMDQQTRSRVFEPFFTTKEQGKGTGLGLAVCYGIVAQAGGHIWVDSTPNRGSVFTILLPAVPDAAVDAEDETQSPEMEPGGGETVLVAEDEPLVRTLAVRTLDAAGFRVLEAEDGSAALAQAAAFGRNIDVLLTDVVMPGMNGVELAERIRRERPGIRIVFMSGYADQMMVPRGLLERGIPLLSKPFDPALLVSTIRESLTEPGSPDSLPASEPERSLEADRHRRSGRG